MKNILYLLLLTSKIFFAQTGFEKGNALYQKGNYIEAVKAYESVLKGNKQSAELYFNIGNCYYKMNKVAPAIYNYEKALVLEPNDKEVQNNLKFAHKLQIDEIKEVPKVGFEKLIRDFTGAFHYNTWAWIAVAFVFLIVFAEVVSVKNEPRVSGSDVFVLHEGTKVFVEEALENWKKIQLTDGTEGWIEESAIREVKQ
jgi:tetratricopeptide (TPR) repeat protein